MSVDSTGRAFSGWCSQLASPKREPKCTSHLLELALFSHLAAVFAQRHPGELFLLLLLLLLTQTWILGSFVVGRRGSLGVSLLS